MADISVSIESNADLIKKALPEQIEQALIAIGMAAESYAKQALTDQDAVDTGRLRASITFATTNEQGKPDKEALEGDSDTRGTPEQSAVYIGTNVEYGSIIENGTSKIGKRPYLRPAAANHTDEYKKFVESAMKA